MLKVRIYRALAAGSVASSVVSLVVAAVAGHKFN
jgi:hypothetical protein